MNVYNPDRKCPKCGCENVSSHFQSEDVPWFRLSERRQDGTQPKANEVNRVCQRCRYSWGEKSLDAKEPHDAR